MQDKDQLEQFISERRSEFDTIEPPKGVWDKIDKELDQQIESPTTGVLWYWKAAVVVLLAAVTFLMVDKFSTEQVQPVEELAEVSEFEELETFYTSIISKKELKLEEAMKGEEAINYLEADIEELELLYNDLRKVYIEEQASPEVYDRLMHLLRRRLHLINAQLDIIAKEKLPEEVKLNTDLSM